MSTLGDIVSLLEKIPIWKRLKTLPEQFDALQARVAVLESEIAKRPSLEQCPICNSGNLKVTAVSPHPTLGSVGVQERLMTCDNPACGHKEKRLHDPVGRMGKK
jgi:hypothetical protein